MRAALIVVIVIGSAFAAGYFSANPLKPAFTAPQSPAPPTTFVFTHSDFSTGFASGTLIALCGALYAIENVKRRESRRRNLGPFSRI